MNNTTLWYLSPADSFETALPLGCGRLGAMLYGAPEQEFLHLNADSVWSGGPRSRINPDARANLPEVRRLLAAGRIAEAEALAFRTMQGCPPDMRHYQPLCNLTVRLTLPDGGISGYKRALDLQNALCTVTFQKGGAEFRREAFASFPAQCIVLHMTGTVPFSAAASLDGRDDDFDRNCIVSAPECDALIFDGCAGGRNGIRFCGALCAAANGTVSHYGNTLTVTDATEATLIFSAETDYNHPDADLEALVLQTLLSARKQPYHALKAAHSADYRTLADRAALELPDGDLTEALPTDELLHRTKQNDPHALNALLRLYFYFGRYLMIAGSRPGSLPLNLQGIWNKDMWPAWGSRFTVNINTQMNYWPAECCNLPECHLPLFVLLRRVMENGRHTAKEMYGAGGFCCHHNTDLWGDTAPQDLWMPATLWPTGGAWLALHIMEHYRFTLDRAFLAEQYEIMHEAARFFTDYLTENEQGQLVSCPSVSPENTYQLPNGESGCLCAGPAMDSGIITELYRAVIEADAILQKNSPLIPLLRAQLPKLPQPQTGKYGQIMEWAADYDEPEPGHRHISQLFALHPARQISPRRTPAMAEAAAETIRRRLKHGGGHTGWSCAWIANMYARLHDSGGVSAMLKKLMQDSTSPNLFDMHPPFQIDGNFGGTSAIAEALLQSDADGITLLPACPAAWHSGAFRGLCAFGGFTLSAAWQAHALTEVSVYSGKGGICRLFLPESAAQQLSPEGFDVSRRENGLLEFDTEPAQHYRLSR